MIGVGRSKIHKIRVKTRGNGHDHGTDPTLSGHRELGRVFCGGQRDVYLPVLPLKQIKSLESELNVQLFDRTNNKIALTPGGTAFLEYARKLNNTYKAMLQDMEQYSSAKKTISMGILPLEQGYRC